MSGRVEGVDVACLSIASTALIIPLRHVVAITTLNVLGVEQAEDLVVRRHSFALLAFTLFILAFARGVWGAGMVSLASNTPSLHVEQV